MTKPHIYLGNLNYSSWSMRPWLVLERSGLEFEDTVIPLRTKTFAEKIGELSPTRLVPVLHTGSHKITDSLAISEWVAEQVPSLWPADAGMRAMARAATAQMHSGFGHVRSQFPVNLRRDSPRPDVQDETLTQIENMQSLWKRSLDSSGGPFLFGQWSIADAFFTPVAARFRSYHIELTQNMQAYCDRLMSEPEFLEWERRAKLETETIPDFDKDAP